MLKELKFIDLTARGYQNRPRYFGEISGTRLIRENMAPQMASYAAKLVGIHFRESHYIFISPCRDIILTTDKDRASFRFTAEFRYVLARSRQQKSERTEGKFKGERDERPRNSFARVITHEPWNFHGRREKYSAYLNAFVKIILQPFKRAEKEAFVARGVVNGSIAKQNSPLHLGFLLKS
ncbi:hypothetical protein K0M31_012177 [Melipona bicolor]|uniref:Uncharacterized protein n=1 Tax=Melipona bicolor TaxID=60889 RepID=A0AA40FKF7_9HYME|nr:hypothetical protein K0M31_012177 [Melipona bicolor]